MWAPRLPRGVQQDIANAEDFYCRRSMAIDELLEERGEQPPRFLEWACVLCHSVQVSDRHKSHQMNSCRCRATSVDAERHYTRVCGCLTVQWMSH